MNAFPSLSLVFLLGLSAISASAALTSIAGKPGHEITLCGKAASTLEALLAEKPGRTAGAIAATGSMAPTLDETFIIVVEKTPYAQLRLEKIAIFHVSWTQNVIAHRITGRLLRGWATKGDACEKADPCRLTEDNFTGYTVVAAIKKDTGEIKYLD